MIAKIQSSLFAKILLIFLAALAVYSWAMKGIHDRFIRDAKFPAVQLMAVTTAQFIAERIGAPPDTAAARALCDSLGVNIHYFAPGFSWKSRGDMPHPEEVDIPVYPADTTIRAGFDKGLLVSLPAGEGRFLVAITAAGDEMIKAAESTLLLSGLVAVAVILLVYGAVRHLLQPLRILHRGVHSLSEGDFDVSLSTKRNDELGTLIHSFGAMAKRIDEMLKARDRLLLDVSHELRSPLTRVKLSLAMMDQCPEQSEIAADIHEMETMITEILESERMASPHGRQEFAPVHLAGLIRETAGALAAIRPGIEIAALPEAVVNGNERQLKILFSNLIKNGLKYSFADGEPVIIDGALTGESVRIVICNQGEEIPEKDLPFIFEPFYRVDKSRAKSSGGYGLGLSLAKRIAEVHGGSLHITSKTGERVKAVVDLPVL
ncbi:HAMP domain-containing histidine kinase [bacterium]|nr:HAMP domain-containing histidine kinase [bacterium]